MKILIAHPGSSFSTHDVFDGLLSALEKQGHDLIHYRLDYRIGIAGAWLNKLLKKRKQAKPTSADILYLACQGILERALRHEVETMNARKEFCRGSILHGQTSGRALSRSAR
jgi:hypothetical protein